MNAMVNPILIIEDDADTRKMLKDTLLSAEYQVIESDCISAGYHLFQTKTPDLVLLDVNLPDGNGVDLCRKIRDHKTLPDVPIIMLTGNSQLEDKEAGFSAGADQYLVKPVPPRELLLWVKALLRRLALDKDEGDVLKAGDLSIEIDSHLVKFKDQVIPHLTGKEFELLHFLVRNRPKVLSRKGILSKLWHTVTVDHVVDTHMTNLRKKLPQELADKLQCIPGRGFRFFEI